MLGFDTKRLRKILGIRWNDLGHPLERPCDDRMYPDTTRISTDPDTTRIYTDPDTTRISTDPDTTRISTDPDTTRIYTDPDTTRISTDPDTTRTCPTPAGQRKTGRPRMTWRQTIACDLRLVNRRWSDVRTLAESDNFGWRASAASCVSSRGIAMFKCVSSVRIRRFIGLSPN